MILKYIRRILGLTVEMCRYKEEAVGNFSMENIVGERKSSIDGYNSIKVITGQVKNQVDAKQYYIIEE